MVFRIWDNRKGISTLYLMDVQGYSKEVVS